MFQDKLRNDIDTWFYYNRPGFEPSREFIDNIINNELKDELVDLETGNMRIILSEYLRLNYGSLAFEIIQEVLGEDEFEEYRNFLDNLIPFVKQGDMEMLVNRVAQRRIIEKYGSELKDLLDNQPLYEEIREVIREVMKTWKKFDV